MGNWYEGSLLSKCLKFSEPRNQNMWKIYGILEINVQICMMESGSGKMTHFQYSWVIWIGYCLLPIDDCPI